MKFQIVSGGEYGVECDEDGCEAVLKSTESYILIKYDEFAEFIEELIDLAEGVKKGSAEIRQLLGL